MLESGQLLCERYQLQQKLGQNAGRQTWLALDVGTEPSEQVIVKLLAFSPQLQWEDFKLFEREAQVLKNLNYPRIPEYRDYFSLDKQTGAGLCWFGLVQNYIPGASLQQLLHQGKRFTEAQVMSYSTEVLEILTYLHELSPAVLHRDIKPSNLILGEDERIYLVDFGAVQDQGAAEGVTFTVVGTSGYAPLEQFWGRAVPASDLYALGATLIHLLTGVAPAELPQRNLRIQFSDRVSLNPTFVSWIEALTEPDLEQRYRTARQALNDLKASRSLSCPLQQIRQPIGSRIQLWKSVTQLKIRLPGRGVRSLLDITTSMVKFLVVFSSLLTLFLLGLLIFALMFLIIAAFHYVWSLLVVIPLIFLLSKLWMSMFREVNKASAESKRPLLNSIVGYSIRFDKNKFVIEQQLFGWSYCWDVGRTSSIKSIKTLPYQGVTIQTDRLKYHFGQDLTDRECSWLSQQMQDWLQTNQRSMNNE